MSVIIRLQNLPWSANAMDIRTFFRGLSIPEGGVHIVGGEQGDAFIAFSTDEDARQAMMNDGGKIKEVQVKLLLSSRSEMHKVIEAARQSVPVMQLAPQVLPVQSASIPPSITGLLAQNMKLQNNMPPGFGLVAPELPIIISAEVSDADKDGRKNTKSNDRTSTRSRSKSKDRDKKDRGRDKKDKRDRSRSRDRDRRRRDRSRSRDRRDRNGDRRRDRKDRSRERDRSKDITDVRMPRKDDSRFDLPTDPMTHMNMLNQQQPKPFAMKSKEGLLGDFPNVPRVDHIIGATLGGGNQFANSRPSPAVWATDLPIINSQQPVMQMGIVSQNSRFNAPILTPALPHPTRFSDINPNLDQIHRLQELDERRNPNAFQNVDHGLAMSKRIPDHRPPYHNQGFGGNIRMQNHHNMDSRGPPLHHDYRSRFDHSNKGQCIKVQNLHHTTRYSDIRRFFFGNFICNQGLKLINDENGKRSGTAYIRFYKPEGKQNALFKNGEFLKGKQLIISTLDDIEFENAIDSYHPIRESEDSGDDSESQSCLIVEEDNKETNDDFKVLILEDLPAFAKEHDIMKMFSDYSLLSIIIIMTKDVRKQYVAYVQFVNAEDAKVALNNKAKHLIGHKIIKVSPCSEAEFERVKANQNRLEMEEVEEATEAEDFNPRNDSSNTSRDPRQRRFDDGGMFNKEPKPYHNMPPNNTPRFPWRGGSNANGAPPHHTIQRDHVGVDFSRLDCTFLKGLPLRTTDRDILDFFSDVGVIPSKIHLMLTIQGEPSGDCFCEFIEPDEAQTAVTKHGSLLGNNIITVELVTKQVVDEARGIIPPEKKFGMRGMGGFRGGGRGFLGRGGRRMRGLPGPFHVGGRGGNRFGTNSPNESRFNKNENAGGPEGFGVPGCVLSLENVPFRAEIEEILKFFGDFNLSSNDVIRRFNENGHPTGDVRVSLRSSADAQRALQKLNMKYIRDRPITISIL